MRKMLLLATACASFAIAAAPAGAGDEEAIAHRKMVIGTAGRAAVSLLHILQGKIDDEEHFVKIARIHADAASMARDAFSVDTSGFDKGTSASDDIWADWDSFNSRLEKYVADAQIMAELAESGDMEAAAGHVEQVFSHCKGCHDNYRE